MKTCSKCKVEKSDLDFLLRGDTGKRVAMCKKCGSAKSRIYQAENRKEIAAQRKIYYAENREEIAAKQKVYRSVNREEIAAKKKTYYAENREEAAAYQKIYRYGVAPDDFKRMLAEQGGVCAICGGFGVGKKGFCIDHDHETGKVRGLLCVFCNQGIGLFKDSSAVAQLAVNYLKQYGK